MLGEFGATEIDPAVRAVLRDGEGRLALLDGTTELRVGVRRPRILLPEGRPEATIGSAEVGA
jgi:hypothetical protein